MVRRLSLLMLAGMAMAMSGGCASVAPTQNVQRYGMVIMVKPEKLAYYKELHAKPWPTVMKQIENCNIRNYSIYLRELEPNKYCLFSYFEYTGKDFDGDMKKMADDPETQRWWKETDPCQYRIMTAKDGEKWSMMEEVFHH